MALGIEKISTTLVGTTLGTSSRDVGTLCTHSAVNIYSKYKPVAHTSMAAADYYKALYTGAEAGKSGDYGLRPPAQTALPITSEVGTLNPALVIFDALDWSYRKPAGGANEPFRLGDFRLYDHYALPFITSIVPNTGNFDNPATDDLVINFNMAPGGTSNIKAADLYNNGEINLSQWKLFGMLIKEMPSSTDNAIVAESLPILNSSGAVQVTSLTFPDLGTLPYKRYKIHVALRSTVDPTKYLPLPRPLNRAAAHNVYPYYFEIVPLLNASDAGGGIANVYGDLAFARNEAPTVDDILTSLYSIYEFGLVDNNSNVLEVGGQFYFRMRLTNTSATARTINVGDVFVEKYDFTTNNFVGSYITDGIHLVDANGLIGNSTYSITIPAGGNVEAWYKVESFFFTGDDPISDNGKWVKFSICLGKYTLFTGSIKYWWLI